MAFVDALIAASDADRLGRVIRVGLERIELEGGSIPTSTSGCSPRG
jgi:hypothetical protein